MPKAIIVGVSGQDGSYLARHLLRHGYEVWGTSRDTQQSSFAGLERLGVREAVRLESMAPTDFRSVLSVVAACRPDEIYNLSGQSSVALSFEQPVETLESVLNATVNILEAVKFVDSSIRFYNACSSECFGNIGEQAANEETPFRPCSPYGVAKAAAYWQLANYRDSYGLFACSGILFNHESPLRPSRFVTSKIVNAARRIAAGEKSRLSLGNLDISRDWGWAPEYVAAMHQMLQTTTPKDCVVATGVTSSLRDFVDMVFREAGLDWREHVDIDDKLQRPTDLRCNSADTAFARVHLGWEARTKMPDVARKLLAGDID